MKKTVHRRKKKKQNHYAPILASGVLIALLVLILSWFFSTRRTYTVMILYPDGREQEYAEYHSLAQAKDEMLAQTKRSEKQNAGIRYDNKLIAIGYGVVQFSARIVRSTPPTVWRKQMRQDIQTDAMETMPPLSISAMTVRKFVSVRQVLMAG